MLNRDVFNLMLPGFEYLKNERHLTDESIRKFHLGYYDAVGNIYADTDAPYTDWEDYKFKNTALFPICNLYGDLIGVSGRNLNYHTNKDLKYVNTVYKKMDHVFGLNVSLPDCIRENRVYIVEGNVDTVMMYQAGVKNVVGMLGGSLSATQICILSRFVDEILIVPDGDTAGDAIIERTVKSKPGKKSLMEKCSQMNVGFSHVVLPRFFDPDKFMREKGLNEFLKLEVIKLNKK